MRESLLGEGEKYESQGLQLSQQHTWSFQSNGGKRSIGGCTDIQENSGCVI